MTVSLRKEFDRLAASIKEPSDLQHALVGHAVRLSLLLEKYGKTTGMLMASRAKQSFVKTFELLETKLQSESQLTASIVEWANGNAAKKVVGITARTQKILSNTIAEGIADNLTADEMTRSLKRACSNMSYSRARTIARTETHQAGMTGQHIGMIQTADDVDIEMEKVWIASGDMRTRPTHAAADDQTVAMDQAFDVGDSSLMYPGDPRGDAAEVINCRCVVGYQPA